MKKVLAFALALALLALCTVPVLAESPTTNGLMTMYLYTDNQRSLNVRSTPYVGDNIIGLAPFGMRINVIRVLDNGWTYLLWNGSEAYVQSRFLRWDHTSTVTTAPATPVPTAVPTADPYSHTTYPYPYTYTDTLATLNAEFRTARIVTPFIVVVRPSRASGWVNMRWAPSKDTEVLATYRSGARLTVIAETQSWYQVVDPDTDATGFMMKAYTTRQY